jgi:hypothetical protein
MTSLSMFCLRLCKKRWSVHRHVCIVFSPVKFSFNHCVISRLGNESNTLLLVGWAKKQCTRVYEPTIFCINLYIFCIILYILILLTIPRSILRFVNRDPLKNIIYIVCVFIIETRTQQAWCY